MITREKVKINELDFTRHYSDTGYKIRKVGTDEVYDDAIDVLDFEYEETDIAIKKGENDG